MRALVSFSPPWSGRHDKPAIPRFLNRSKEGNSSGSSGAAKHTYAVSKTYRRKGASTRRRRIQRLQLDASLSSRTRGVRDTNSCFSGG